MKDIVYYVEHSAVKRQSSYMWYANMLAFAVCLNINIMYLPFGGMV